MEKSLTRKQRELLSQLLECEFTAIRTGNLELGRWLLVEGKTANTRARSLVSKGLATEGWVRITPIDTLEDDYAAMACYGNVYAITAAGFNAMCGESKTPAVPAEGK